MQFDNPIGKALVITALLSVCGSAYSKEQKDDVISLDVLQLEPGYYRPFIDVIIDGRKKRFEFDTGAPQTFIEYGEDISQYRVESHKGSGGGFGTIEQFDVIRPQSLQIGQHKFLNLPIQRGLQNQKRENLLGIDCLKDTPFEIDFKNGTLTLLSQTPDGIEKLPLRRFKTGHLMIPIKVGKTNTYALFDTGAEKTCVDLNFVKHHSESFRFIRSNQGKDSVGKMQETPLYSANSVQIGNLMSKDVEVVAWQFAGDFKKKMEDVPIILGSNVIYNAKWIFDLKQGNWSVSF